MADAAKAAGLDAQVHTKTVEAKDGQAGPDKLVIRYPAADMQPVSQDRCHAGQAGRAPEGEQGKADGLLQRCGHRRVPGAGR